MSWGSRTTLGMGSISKRVECLSRRYSVSRTKATTTVTLYKKISILDNNKITGFLLIQFLRVQGLWVLTQDAWEFNTYSSSEVHAFPGGRPFKRADPFLTGHAHCGVLNETVGNSLYLCILLALDKLEWLVRQNQLGQTWRLQLNILLLELGLLPAFLVSVLEARAHTVGRQENILTQSPRGRRCPRDRRSIKVIKPLLESPIHRASKDVRRELWCHHRAISPRKYLRHLADQYTRHWTDATRQVASSIA